jgi:hypothetical protein
VISATGIITAPGDVSASGLSLVTHVHGGVTTGPGVTGPGQSPP